MREIADVTSLLDDFQAGRERALARAISLVESGAGSELVQALYARSGRALTVGITGPPGVGKSTLAAALVRRLRRDRKEVGVVAVDPSSPFSRGALLGDRIRHADHFDDRGVFIRSMANRGHPGGLAGATADTVLLMDAFGKDVVLIETVGVGQSEIEIAELASTTIVVLQPGSGDAVQLLKAGVLEIADIFVVNKADHPGARDLVRELKAMPASGARRRAAAVIATQANEGVGVDELWDAIEAHRRFLEESGELAARRRAALAYHVRQLVIGRLGERIEAALARIESAAEDPYRLAERIVRDL